jgi:hypothetical protein
VCVWSKGEKSRNVRLLNDNNCDLIYVSPLPALPIPWFGDQLCLLSVPHLRSHQIASHPETTSVPNSLDPVRLISLSLVYHPRILCLLTPSGLSTTVATWLHALPEHHSGVPCFSSPTLSHFYGSLRSAP